MKMMIKTGKRKASRSGRIAIMYHLVVLTSSSPKTMLAKPNPIRA